MSGLSFSITYIVDIAISMNSVGANCGGTDLEQICPILSLERQMIISVSSSPSFQTESSI